MSLFKFATNLLAANVKQVVDELVGAAVAANPTAATEAEMQTLRERVDEAAAKVAELQVRLNKEKAEAEAKRRDLDRLIRGANNLQDKIETTEDTALRAELEDAMVSLIPQLQQAETELEQEEDDVVRVQALVTQAQDILEERSKAWASARDQLKRATDELERARMQKEQAETRRADAEELAQLRQSAATNRIGSALSKLQQAAMEAQTQAKATDLVTDTLSRARTAASGNKHVAAALAEVERAALPSPSAVSSRAYLANLSAKRKKP